MTARAIIIHSIDHARAALAAAAARTRMPVVLYSAEGAAAYAGAGWFRDVIAAAQTEHPNVACEAVLDCGDRPGLALAALRDGCRVIALRGKPALLRKITDIATAQGARIAPSAATSLDLNGCSDPEAAVTSWFRERPSASGPASG